MAKKIFNAPLPQKPWRFIIADDAKADLVLMEKLLTKLGHTVVARCANGEDFLDACLGDQEAEVAIVDINMPVRNGFELAALVNKERKQSLPFLFASSFKVRDKTDELEQLLTQAVLPSLFDYIEKPLDIAWLAYKILCLVQRGANQYVQDEERKTRTVLGMYLVTQHPDLVIENDLELTENDIYTAVRSVASRKQLKFREVARLISHGDQASTAEVLNDVERIRQERARELHVVTFLATICQCDHNQASKILAHYRRKLKRKKLNDAVEVLLSLARVIEQTVSAPEKT